MIGVTTGEVKNQEKSIARAIDSVFWRILIFYVGAVVSHYVDLSVARNWFTGKPVCINI